MKKFIENNLTATLVTLLTIFIIATFVFAFKPAEQSTRLPIYKTETVEVTNEEYEIRIDALEEEHTLEIENLKTQLLLLDYENKIDELESQHNPLWTFVLYGLVFYLLIGLYKAFKFVVTDIIEADITDNKISLSTILQSLAFITFFWHFINLAEIELKRK